MFTLGNFAKITEAAQTFEQRFSPEKSSGLISIQSGLGYTLGDFFTNSSGHTSLVY
jgi:hypothetical protein